MNEHREVTLVPFRYTEEELALVFFWLNDPETARLYDGRDNVVSLDQLRKIYYSGSPYHHYFIRSSGGIEGVLTIYLFSEEMKIRHGMDSGSEKVFCLDLFLCGEDRRGKHFGTEAVKKALERVFTEFRGDRAVLDTWSWHEAALRCYRNAGFEITRVLKDHDRYLDHKEDCVFLEIDRELWREKLGQP